MSSIRVILFSFSLIPTDVRTLGTVKPRNAGATPAQFKSRAFPARAAFDLGHNARRAAPAPELPKLVGVDAVDEDLAIEGLGIDFEERGGLAAVSADSPQGRDDVLPLHPLEAAGGGGRRGRRPAAGHFGREILGLDLVTFAEDHRALDRVLKLAHVAGPAVALEHGQGRRPEPLDAVGRVALDEVPGEHCDVLAALPQWRQLNG